MADEHDEEIRELHAGLTRHLDERTAALLMKRVMALDDRDRVTRQDLADLGAAIMARFEQVDQRFEQVETELVRLAGRIGQVDGRIDSRREFDDARFEMLAARVDNGFDRLQSDLRGQLLVAVTTQTRTLLLALLGSFAAYAVMTLSLVR